MSKLLRNKKWLVALAVASIVIALFLQRSFLGTNTGYVTVKRGSILQTVVATGHIETPARIEIASHVLGRVTQLFAVEGTRVTTNQLVLELDDREARATRDQALTNLQITRVRLEQLESVTSNVAEGNAKQARANLQLAQSSFNNAKSLLRDGFITQNQFDEAKLKLDIAQSALQSAETIAQSQRNSGADYKLAQLAVREAEARLRLAETQVEDTKLLAPADGTIVARNIEVGNIAQPGKTLLTLVKDGKIQATANVDENNLALLRVGQRAWLSADAFGEDRVAAQLQYIAPAVDASRGTVEIKLDIDQAPDYLRPDMTVTIEIIVQQIDNALTLPTDAVRELNGGQPWVLLVTDNRTQRREVKLGVKGEGSVQILAGVAENDIVVPLSENKIAVDRKVRLRSEDGAK